MGGRGGSSGFQNNSAIGNKKPITVDVTYRGSYYGEVFQAKQIRNGVLEVSYNNDTEWEQQSRSTSIVHHNLKAGIYNTSGKVNQYGAYSSYDSHNINWKNVKEVHGKTYHLGQFLREKGFKWDKIKKAWIK